MAHEENKAFLRRVPLLASLSESQLDALAAGSVRRAFPKGRTIVAEGEPSQSLYILLSGRAKVQRSDSDGKEVILAVLGSGECFGEMSLIDDAPRSASVITLESCDFMAINKDSFKAMLAQSHDKLPRQEIAKMIGASREMVSRVMKGLEVDGYIVPAPEGRLVLREKLSSYLH